MLPPASNLPHDGKRKKAGFEKSEPPLFYIMYIDPRVSPHDIATQFAAQGVRSYYGNPFSRSTISLILRNPIYAMADLDIYEFFKSQGTEISPCGQQILPRLRHD